MEPAATPSDGTSASPETWEQICELAHQRCKGRGVAFTPFREAILRQIAVSKQPRGAYEIAAELSQQMGKRIVPNSVYRVLDVLIECGLVQRVESKHAYCLAPAHHSAGVLLLMCEDCGWCNARSGNSFGLWALSPCRGTPRQGLPILVFHGVGQQPWRSTNGQVEEYGG